MQAFVIKHFNYSISEGAAAVLHGISHTAAHFNNERDLDLYEICMRRGAHQGTCGEWCLNRGPCAPRPSQVFQTSGILSLQTDEQGEWLIVLKSLHMRSSGTNETAVTETTMQCNCSFGPTCFWLLCSKLAIVNYGRLFLPQDKNNNKSDILYHNSSIFPHNSEKRLSFLELLFLVPGRKQNNSDLWDLDLN